MAITKIIAENALTYEQYMTIIKDLFAAGKSTGNTQSEAYLAYTKINQQRYSRLEKTLKILPELKQELDQLKSDVLILIITEGWCGDSAQNIPAFELMARNSERIKVRYVLRDENPEIMDQYLTNGSRSVPKAIVMDAQNLKEKFTWGPRPAILQDQVKKMVADGISKEERGTIIHAWYNKDLTQTTQKELADLFRKHFH